MSSASVHLWAKNNICKLHLTPSKYFCVEGPDFFHTVNVISLYFSVYLKCILIHYKDEGVSASSVLKTPSNGSESLNGDVWLRVEGNVGSIMQVKQQEGSRCC